MTAIPPAPPAVPDLPTYADAQLAAEDADGLVRLLVRNEDRVPRNLIEACATRGDEILERMGGVLEKDYYWSDDQTDGEWWLRFHAVMILGLMPHAAAGDLLVRFMQRIDEADDDTLSQWLSAYWPALLRNKPDSFLPALRALALDRALGCYTRSEAVNAIVALAQWAGAAQLDAALSWAAGIAFDDSEDFELRVLVGSTLLDFARPQYRRKLERMADLQSPEQRVFDRVEIGAVYLTGAIEPQWEWTHFKNPWTFYDSETIGRRQREWAEAEAQPPAQDRTSGETYVRAAPKVGRNEPCPCGSGKKYKNCCLKGAG